LGDAAKLEAVRAQLKVPRRVLCCGRACAVVLDVLCGCGCSRTLALRQKNHAPPRNCHTTDSSAPAEPHQNQLPPKTQKQTKNQRADLSAEQLKVLRLLERSFAVNILETDAARAMKERLNSLEAALAETRNAMELGYVDEGGAAVPGSSVVLRNVSALDGEKRDSCLTSRAHHRRRCLLPPPLPHTRTKKNTTNTPPFATTTGDARQRRRAGAAQRIRRAALDRPRHRRPLLRGGQAAQPPRARLGRVRGLLRLQGGSA
jgi:hypothetical protein